MINGLANVFTSFGLSSSAGLNAYLPLLIVALTARFTNLIELRPPFDWLTNPWVIGVLVVLLLIETVADKIPAVDHANDVIQTVVRPAAGAILFAANSNAISNIHPGVRPGLRPAVSRKCARHQGHAQARGNRYHRRPGQSGG